MVYSLVKLLFSLSGFFPILCYAMNKKTTLRHMGEVVLVLISVSNAAFADASSERLDAYKGNKLLSPEVNIATINSASSEHSDVAVFTPSVLSWKSYSNMQDAAFSKFMDWTKEDFEEFFKGYTWNTYEKYVDAWNFLSQTGNDHLQGAVISDEDAIAVLQAQLEKLLNEDSIDNRPFPCEGLDFSGLNLAYAWLNNFTGMTAEQLFSAAHIGFATLPAIDFTGVDFGGKDLHGIDMSRCTGITAEQLLAAKDIGGTTLPSVNFAGANLSGLDLNGVDLSKCTNLTASQLLSASDIRGTSLPAIDFTGADLSGKNLGSIDFSLCTGLTGKQLAAASSIQNTNLPAIDFTGADLSGKSLISVDFSMCTGLSASQVLAATSLTNVKLPAIDFSGVDLTGKRLYGVDFTKCTGLTGTQLSNATNISYIRLTSEQYESMKTDLPSGKTIWVNDILTRIP